MNKIGVNIDLSVFFEDERKMILVMVDPKWESVECLQKRVEFLFDVDSVRFINSDGCFVPPQEPIEIIKYCKALKAFVPKESLEKRKIKKSKKAKKVDISSKESESEESKISVCTKEDKNNAAQKKRKFYSLQSGFSASSTPHSAKRLKNCISIHKEDSLNKINKSSEISSTSEQIIPPQSSSSPSVRFKEKSKKSKSSLVPSDYRKPIGEKISDPCELSAGDGTQEKKDSANSEINAQYKKCNTPTPKPKDTSHIFHHVENTFQSHNDEMESRPSSIPSSTFINESKMTISNKKSLHSTNAANNPFKRQSSNKSKGHMYFNESGEMVSTITTSSKSTPKKVKENEESKALTIFRCSLNNVSDGSQKPRIFQIKPISKERKKQVVEIQQEIIIATPKETDLNEPQTLNLIEHKKKISSNLTETLKNTTTDSLNYAEQTSSLNNTKIYKNKDEMSIETLNTSAINSNHDQTSMENLETPQSVEDTSKNQTNTKAALDESSVLSVECDDFSIVIDDEEDDRKSKKPAPTSDKVQSHDLTKDDNDSSDVEEISEIIDLNETEDNCDSTVNSSKEASQCSDIVVHKILPFCTDLVELPNVDDIIVFKVSYFNKKQKLVYTNFMAGKAEYINKRTKSIKILILDGLSELSNVPNTFLCNLDESQDDVKYVQLKLSEMIEPKLFSRS